MEKGCLSQSKQHGKGLRGWGEVNQGIQAQYSGRPGDFKWV